MHRFCPGALEPWSPLPFAIHWFDFFNCFCHSGLSAGKQTNMSVLVLLLMVRAPVIASTVYSSSLPSLIKIPAPKNWRLALISKLSIMTVERAECGF